MYLLGGRMSKNNKLYIILFVILYTLFRAQFALGDAVAPTPDTPRNPIDTTGLAQQPQDTASLRNDKGKRASKKSGLNAIVDYTASDSIVFSNGNMANMYGKGVVKYEDIELNAEIIRMNMDSSTVYAVGRVDSLGEVIGNPVFKDKSGEYESKTMNYNFKTEKGFITEIVTQQGEGYLTGGQTKKMESGEFYMRDGKYTTCDNHEHPHFYLQLTKAKVRPKKDIVTGPAYMVLADVPLPLAIPFGFFPFTSKYSSGIIMPTFGDDYTRGFYLRNGGYYFAINDYIDLALTGEIYTKGSWGVNARSAYIKRYKFSGNFDIGYLVSVYGDKGLPDYSKMQNFKVAWTHTQDSKASPNMSFSASVNFATSGYNRNDINSYYNYNSFTENTKSSTINFTYRFPNSPFSISATTNITQRTQDSTLNVSLPNLTITMSQIYPFRRKVVVGKERWYEKIQLSYSGRLQNSIQTKQDKFFKSSLVKDWRNAMYHSIPISASFTAFKYLNMSVGLTFNDRMYTNKITQAWDPQASAVVRDTTYGFYNVYDFSGSMSASTKLYGFYTPLKFLGGKVEKIRHIFTPTISLSAAPDFSNPFWGFYKRYERPDINGDIEEVIYSPFSHGLYGTAPSGKQGVVTFGMSNNVEMKVKSDRDSTGVRKISLIENFSANMGYNFAADSMNWSNLNTSILIKLTKDFNLNLSMTWDTYTYQLNSYGNPVRVNIPRWKAGKGLGRLSSTGTSFSYTLNNNTFKKKEKKRNKPEPEADEMNVAPPSNPLDDRYGEQRNRKRESADDEYDDDGYLKWKVPWSLSINYSINYGYGTFNKKKMEYNGKITQNLSFSGNISFAKNWTFTLSSSFNFDTGKIAYMNCSITRDMHCWTMSASFIPVGPYKSYNFHISVKSSLLSDLKLDKSGNSYRNALDWY